MGLSKILLTRAPQHATTLLAKLKKFNIQVHCDPLFTLQPLLSIQDRPALIATALASDIAIFISRNAVDVVLPILGNELSWCWVALGPGTAQQLHSFGVERVLYASKRPANANSMLQYISTKMDLNDQRIMIFCGADPDPWLTTQLQMRGAQVEVRGVYRRVMPKTLQFAYDIDAAIVTCVTSLMSLYQLAPELDVPLIVISDRILQVALEMGYSAVYNSQGISDQNIISALAKVNKCMTK